MERSKDRLQKVSLTDWKYAYVTIVLKIDKNYPLQAEDTATGTRSFCSYYDLEIYKMDKLVKE